MKQPYNTALYMRLSRDDENYGDSVSIETQRTILQQYAKEHGLSVYGEYVDDGWSGTNFERPSFQRMMDDVEAGKVNCIITKDLSRFGREHVMMDYYLEFVFPEKQIRYIAVAENEDTEKGLSDFVPFKNLFNEWFAKDTSRKVKTALRAKFAAGERTFAYAPEEKSYAWTIAQVKSILQDETYIGNSVHNKQTNISYKNKKKVRKPKEEWIRVENTHEAIISRDVFEQVQKQIASRRRQQKDATTQIFAGLVKCADCGWSMRFGTNRQNKTPYSHFTCSQYGQMGTQCSAHYIRYDTLYVYVLSRIQYWSHRAQLSEEKLLQQILKNGDRERMTAAKRQESELQRAEKRKAEVDGKFVRMYEDWSAGRITEYNFNLLTKKYQAEQLELEEKISRLQAELTAEQQTALDAEKWVALIKQYANPTELTAELLNTLIEKIVIHEATKGADGMRDQEIEIYYRFIGKID